MGRGYAVECCMAAFRRRQEERLYRAYVTDALKYIAENPQYAFFDKYYRTAYPNNKRMVIFPTEEKVRSLNLDRMFEIYQERFAFANNQTFFFVGNVSDSNIAMIANYLNHLPTIAAVTKDYFIPRETEFAKGIVHDGVKKGIEKQGMMIMCGEMKVPGSELDPQTRMAIQQLGECLSITVTEIIREKNGDAYSPSASAGASVSLTGKGTDLAVLHRPRPRKSQEG